MKGDLYKDYEQKLLCSCYNPSLLRGTGKTHYKLSYSLPKIVRQQIQDSVGNSQNYIDFSYLCF